MGYGVAEKVLLAHLVTGKPEPGEPVSIKIAQTLTQDATGTMTYLQFESLQISKVRTELSVSYVDHNTLQDGFENADDHHYLQSIAQKFGIVFSRPGNGICHQVHLERFGLPGKTMLGSDSHTPTGGGLGMIAIGAGGLDVALAMAGRPFNLTWPKITKINLTGSLRDFVSAKDVIFEILRILTTRGNVGTLLEYGGPGVETLSIPQRATITNMGAETGVTTSIFPCDSTTLAFLKAQKRALDCQKMEADSDAHYERIIDIDLSTITPLVAAPHSPDNIKPISELAGTRVNQVCIGSCTNSSFQDLMLVADLLHGRHVAENVSLIIAPGSRQVMEMIAKNSALAEIIASGARIAESACGFCIGQGHAPGTEAISVRTSNRNFRGRSGTPSANIYLTSPELAVLAALKGEFVNPLNADYKYPRITQPDNFPIAKNQFIFPPKSDENIKIQRGPNISNPPVSQPLPDLLQGIVTLKVGDKITTDHIMPAGSRLKYRSNIPRYAEFVFESVDPTFPARCRSNYEKNIANFVVAAESYGQGSSREHAAICPMFLGVRVIIAKSIERIHSANLINFGILPLLFKESSDYDSLEQDSQLEIKNLHSQLQDGSEIKINNLSTGKTIILKTEFSSQDCTILLAGGRLAYEKSLL